jgi:DNA replication protein DnaC
LDSTPQRATRGMKALPPRLAHLTTNRELKDLYALFPNPVIAEGLLDRLLNSAYVITMLGQSYRPRLSPGQRREELGVAN